jgi:PAS domain S-box-containing protein
MALDESVLTLSRLTDRLAKAEVYQSIQTDVAETLIATTTMRDAMPRILRTIGVSLNWQLGIYWSPDSQNCLRAEAIWQSPKLDAPDFIQQSEGLKFCSGESMPGRVWSSGTSVWFTDFDQQTFVRSSTAKKYGIKAAIAFPIYADLEMIGIIEFFSTESTEKPDNNLLDVLTNVGLRIGQFYKKRELERALREADARYRVLIDSTYPAVIVAEANGIISEWNVAAEELFGWKKSEAVGHPLVLIIPERYRAAHLAGMDRVRQNDHTQGSRVIGKITTLHGLRKDGTEFPIDLSLSTWNTTGRRFFGAIIKTSGD